MKHRFILLVVLALTWHTALAVGPPEDDWVGSWLTAPTAMPLKDGAGNRTFRSVAHLSLGGTALRVELTNQFGTTPLRIGSAHIGLSAGAGKVQVGTDHGLTFNHQLSVSIPAGSYAVSDPIPLSMSDFADLAISVYVPQQTVTEPTCHQYALSTTYVVPGDATAQAELADAKTMTSTCFLQSVIVQSTDKKAGAVVALGDSITDGAHSTVDANHRYPDYLAERLHAHHKTSHLAVLNAGISGGRVLYEGHGPSAFERFDRDVLVQPGVRYVIYLEGINDIGQVTRATSPENNLTADELIFAATQLVTRAHLHGIKVVGATLTPFGPKIIPDRPGWSRIRPLIEQYNNWVRTSGIFDGVVDFNKATADPQDPQVFLPAYDSGDHVHPSDAGYKAMADSVDLHNLSK